MKIDKTKLKKSSSEVPNECKQLIERLKGCNERELLEALKSIKSWNYGKCELNHWVDVLDLFDSVLEKSVYKDKENQWALPCDLPHNESQKELLIHVLLFTALLIEHSFSKHIYNSMEHLTALLSSSDMQIVLAVLNLLYVFSKRSNFISRLSSERRQALYARLNYLAELSFDDTNHVSSNESKMLEHTLNHWHDDFAISWGGKENGFGLAECCQDSPMSSFPSSATTLHFEYYCDESSASSGPMTTSSKKSSNTLNIIHIDNVDQIKDKNLAQIMEELVDTYSVPKDKQMLLFTHLRLAHIYCNAMSLQDNSNNTLYNGFIEELVDILELKDAKLLEIKSAALRTLTSIIHLDHNSKLNTIIDVTGAASYHGFLPTLVRSCIQALIDGNTEQFPLPFATALFSFLYHLASYENGGEALVSCGMIESLLKVISWKGNDPEHITFVTRAVRVIDLITNLEMTAFQNHGGLNVFIQRLEYEVDICRKQQPFVIDICPNRDSPDIVLNDSGAGVSHDATSSDSPMEVDNPSTDNAVVTSGSSSVPNFVSKEVTCYPQRAAVLKSMLNFLKKAIQDSAFSDSIRHLMEGSLPRSLRHIISNAEYYGPSLFMLATDVVTVYVFQEPSLLSSLQENGLTDVVLHALLVKEIPPTREVIASLPNVFSALCLNSRGLDAFVALKPFEKIFKVLLSPDYLPAMRRRRSSEPMGDTSSNLGTAMDELMRHQPSLRESATAAIIALLKELCALGSDPNCVCSKPASKNGDGSGQGSSDRVRPVIPVNMNTPADGSSDEDEDEEDENTGATSSATKQTEQANVTQQTDTKQPVPLVDYILHVMRFVDAVLSNNSTDDHCREFVKQHGLEPLLKIFQLPNLPIDFPLTPACSSVTNVCKSILSLAHEREVLKESLKFLNNVLENLQDLYRPLDPPGGSVLLEELVQATIKSQGSDTDPLQSSALTPLLHGMSAAHAYISMFAHVCRTGQVDLRNLLVTHWGSDIGLTVLKGLSRLYTSLVWESTVLLALCYESSTNANWQFGRHQLEKLIALSKENESNIRANFEDQTATTSTAKMEVDENIDGVENDSSKKKDQKSVAQNKLSMQMKQIKPLLSSASRLGRALADLFGLLVKLCVGSPIRHRRSHHTMPNAPIAPSPPARAVARALTKLLASGLSWTPPPTSPIPKFRLTFYICSVGFTSPMLFDERKYPYHLMLQKFVQCGGQDAFFQTFKWALTQDGKVSLEEGLEHPDLPDGTGEFLDSWLMLLEKMVNPKMVLESPHTMPTKASQPNFVPFDPVAYLIRTHKKAFECIMHIWNKKPLKVYGERMSESVLAILCHLLRGETIIAEKLSKDKDVDGQSNASASGSRSSRRNELEEQGISSEQLQQLIDMGFARDLALEALLHSSSLEQATEYLLSHPTLNRSGNAGDWEMSEEDQMMRAIAMSLGCLRLLDTLPDTVYRVCDLLLAVCQRNGEKWSENIIKQLLNEISENVQKLLESTKPMTSGDKRTVTEWASQVTQIPEASKAATRIHLFTLIFEERRNECAFLLQETSLTDNLIQLLEAAQNALTLISNNKVAPVSTPKWLAPVVLLIDLYEKSAVASHRRAPLLALPRRQWKWFDDRTGRWSSYAVNNNKTIDDAYKAGESFVRFCATRRKYVVQFSTMVQINEESGNWRPIMFVHDDKAMDVTEEGASASTTSSSKTCNYKIVKTLQPQQCITLIRASVGFMNIPVEPDTLHAVMRLCLRLTRNYEHASLFAELGGVRAILQLTQASAFTGFTSLATLLIRHVLEEPTTLRQTMEKVIRSTTFHSPMSCREMHYILRVLGPAACRESELFLEVAKSILRISFSPLTKREDEDSRLLGPSAVQMLKLLPTKQSNFTVQPTNIVREVVSDLLNSLTIKNNVTNEEGKDQSNSSNSDAQSTTRLNRESSSSDLIQQDDIDENVSVDDQPVASSSSDSANKSSSNTKDDESLKKSRLLLSQSAILRLLAELVRSYSVVAKLITDHVYQPAQSEFINEECTALSFILDQLLPNTQTVGDKDCPALTRVLVAALSSCNHCPEAQTTLINEVKSALHRALNLSESSEKHAKIQAITNVLSTMIDSCPSSSINQSSSQLNIPSSLRNQSTGLNNMVKIMLRRGIVTDLARITHSLDLSSPHMATTVNSALKPLETLSRIINLPNTQMSVQAKKPKTGHASGTSNTEAMEEDNVPSVAMASNGVQNSVAQTTDSSRVTGPDSGYDLTETGEVNTETSTSETNAFADVTVDENTDNEGVVIEEGVPFDLYNDGHPRPTSLMDELRNGHENHNEDAEEVVDESHDNVVNSNGAESENDEAAGYVEDEIGDAVMRFSDRENDQLVFDIEDMLPTSVFQEGSFRLSSLLPMLESEHHVSSGDVTQPSLPPAPGNVTASHPLLVRHGDAGGGLGLSQTTASTTANILASRSHRSGRQRIYRPNVNNSVNNHHNWHMQMNSRHPNPPIILQRLLGPSTAQDFLQMTSGTTSSQPTRLIFTSNDFQFIATDEDWLDLHDSAAPVGSGSSSALGSIPSAMLRWTEESRVLDGDSMHDCVASLKPEIIEVWEKYLANESSLNANTERLAESIVEQVLGPAIASSTNTTSEATEHSATMEINENQATSSTNEALVQNDNEITEMVCSETTAEHEKPVAMDVNGASASTETPAAESESEAVRENDISETAIPPPPPARASSNEATTESLSLVSNDGVNDDGLESDERRDNFVPIAPEPNNVVEVTNDLSNANQSRNSEIQASLGDVEIPEGVDPSFLAALPENIRQEVIAEQLRLQRLQQQRNSATTSGGAQPSSSSNSATANTFNEVNPEFLAALPPNIQEEVLAQQRAEQQRLQAQNSNPDTPVDPASFISTLPPGLRRQVLADMDDSLLALLPGDLAAEAQSLRLELETRHRQMQERFFSNHATTALSRILRTAIDASLAAGRMSHTRYTIHTVQPATWPWNISSRGGNSSFNGSTSSTMKPSLQGKIRGRQLLDNEALSCLLILLFVDEPKLNIQRLHRVLKNLCQHPPTRQWVVQSLLAIMDRIKDAKEFNRPRKGSNAGTTPNH
ncbi:E3 ubiquitin-protein ligase HUWE1-like protein, partial [Dinothrombium tinctorium]